MTDEVSMCRSCASGNLTSLDAEVNIHFSRLRGVEQAFHFCIPETRSLPGLRVGAIQSSGDRSGVVEEDEEPERIGLQSVGPLR
jgi:hypothetical protein